MLCEDRKGLSSLTQMMSRIFAISDIHVDIKENLRLVESWSGTDFRNDVLIVAGDVTDNTSLLKTVLKSLVEKFSKVCYVPGTVIFILEVVLLTDHDLLHKSGKSEKVYHTCTQSMNLQCYLIFRETWHGR